MCTSTARMAAAVARCAFGHSVDGIKGDKCMRCQLVLEVLQH